MRKIRGKDRIGIEEGKDEGYNRDGGRKGRGKDSIGIEEGKGEGQNKD